MVCADFSNSSRWGSAHLDTFQAGAFGKYRVNAGEGGRFFVAHRSQVDLPGGE